EGIPTISWDVGGTTARAVRFFPTTGRTQRRLIGGDQVGEIVRTESSFLDTLKHSRIEGTIELF
ncbi:chemotaxis protein, partial [bacterium]|nr:chemotaxis protein [bacterium]